MLQQALLSQPLAAALPTTLDPVRVSPLPVLWKQLDQLQQDQMARRLAELIQRLYRLEVSTQEHKNE